MILTIPLEQYPNQVVSTVINSTRWNISLFTRLGQLFASVENDTDGVIIENIICLDRVPITKNLVFLDIFGTQNPTYTDLNSRFFLVWTDE